MRRVLVVDEALPWPADSGKRIRTTALLSRLAEHFAIELAYHEDGPPDRDAVAAASAAGLALLPVRRKPLVKRGLRFAADLARNVIYPGPYMVMAHRTRAMRTALAGRLEGATPPDLVHVEWTPLVANVPVRRSVPVAIAAHNIEADIWQRYYDTTRSGARRAYIGLQRAKVARYERRAFAEADLVTAVSEHDAARISAYAAADRVVVVPNGVDETYFQPRPGESVPDRLVFVGALDWRPNQAGVLWFLEYVWPLLLAKRPQATLQVVGRHPPPAWQAQVERTPRVALHANVPDVRPYMAAGSAFIVPLLVGGGSRLKICEALAMQRPVVSTTIGAEGLSLGDGLSCADGAEDFAAAVLHVLDNPASTAAMAARGRERVLAHHRWDAIAPLQAEAWERLANRVLTPRIVASKRS